MPLNKRQIIRFLSIGINIMDKFITFLKIFGSLIFAYILVLGLSTLVFLDGRSPALRDNIPSYIASVVQEKFSANKNIAIINQSINDRYVTLGKTALQNIAPGVKAREMDGVSEVYYDSQNIKWKKYTYTLSSGQKITINVQDGQLPPPGATPL